MFVNVLEFGGSNHMVFIVIIQNLRTTEAPIGTSKVVVF